MKSSKIRSWSSGAIADAGVGDRERDRALGTVGDHRDPDLAPLGELQGVGDEVPQDLRDLGLVGPERGTSTGSSKTSRTASPTSRGAACRGARRTGPVTSNSLGRTTILPASTLARSSRSPTSSDRSCAALRMNSTCRTCSDVRSPSTRRRRSAAQREDRVQGGAELVAHVREEARLHLVGAPQVVGALVELGVQGDDAPVGVVQLAIDADELVLPGSEVGQRARGARGSAAGARRADHPAARGRGPGSGARGRRT